MSLFQGLYECVAHTSAGRKTSVGTEVHVVSEYNELFVFIWETRYLNTSLYCSFILHGIFSFSFFF